MTSAEQQLMQGSYQAAISNAYEKQIANLTAELEELRGKLEKVRGMISEIEGDILVALEWHEDLHNAPLNDNQYSAWASAENIIRAVHKLSEHL